MTQLHRFFERNAEGRDFVIGDLHGAWPMFERLLEGINFDPAIDRMFSVGDLVDRGPESLRCLSLLHEPWFHSIMGNHEKMMLDAFVGGPSGSYWVPNGGGWGLEMIADLRRSRGMEGGTHILMEETVQLVELLNIVNTLPLVLTIERSDGSLMHVLHAELPARHALTSQDLMNEDVLRDLLTRDTAEDGPSVIWGRHRYQQFIRASLQNTEKVGRTVEYLARSGVTFSSPGLGHVISGHSIVQQPLTLGEQTNLDTGAFFAYLPEHASSWNALTCVELETGSFFQVKADRKYGQAEPTLTFTEVEPLVVTVTKEQDA